MANGFVDPRKVIASMPPVLYGMLLMVEAGDMRFWVVVTAIVVLDLAMVAGALDYPISPFLPALAGAFLATTCTLALLQGSVDAGPVPFTHTATEFWACYLLAVLYVAWGVSAARKVLID